MTVSVVIPAFNNAAGLRACLAALVGQSMPARGFEVMVVDDGSTPPLDSTAGDFRASLNLRYLRTENRGPATARNSGAQAADGRYLAFTDHDCVPGPDWLAALVECLAANPDCLAGGPKQCGLPDNPYAMAHQIASDYAEAWFASTPGAAGYFTTNNLGVAREAFLRIGGFSERFSFAHEDREFGARAAERGLGRAWAPRAIVTHRHELTMRTFARQWFRYGAGAVDYREARRRSVPFEGVRFHAGLPAAPFRSHGVPRACLLAALLVLAQGAYAAGVAARASR